MNSPQVRPSLGRVVLSLALMAGALLGAETDPQADRVQQREQRTLVLVSEADQAVRQQRLDVAHDLYVQALLINPGHVQARAGAEALLRLRIGGQTQITSRDLDRLQASQAAATARRMRTLAMDATPEQAVGRLQDAMLVLRVRDPDGEAAQEVLLTAQALVKAEQGITKDQIGQDHQRRAQVLGAGSASVAQVTTQRERERAEVLARIEALVARDHFELALARLRVAMQADPTHTALETLWHRVLDMAHTQRRLDTKATERERHKELSRLIESAMIPDSLLPYPVFAPDWASRAQRRHAALVQGVEATAEELDLDARLNERVSFSVVEASALDLLQSLCRDRVPLVIDGAVLTGPERLVTLHVRDMSLRNAITWLCQTLQTPWGLSNNAVYVGKAPLEPSVTMVHDAAIFGITVKELTPLSHGITGLSNGAQGGVADLFAAPSAGDAGKGISASPSEILELLTRSVAPDYWTSPGANPPQIRGGLLIVVAPPRIQRLVAEFIRAQSRLQALSVHCELRFLELSDQFVEQIGVNWNVGEILRPVVNGLYRLGDSYEIAARTRTTDVIPALGGSQPVALDGRSGITLQWAQLGETQIGGILRAVESGAQARELHGISITTFSGIQAGAQFITESAYIKDYTPVQNGSQATNFDPEIGSVSSGIEINVRPIVSSDRRYITAELLPAIASVQFYRETIRAGVILQDPPEPENEDDEPVAAEVTNVELPIELPNLFIKSAATNVRVPDRGSILVGGFGRAIHQRAEARVPWLSDIPFLGRVFSTRARLDEQSRLFLYARFTIIDLPELESSL